ncbi:hypothetical protein BHE90_004996 [Fusarium euwallaceae]|uniref:Uncharacterized protein n=1 Tax=Fusarium euwallaceae TaxID=1147111 RepID=A0A430LXN8_9HYPO|nr:hypothetical protein BHE90_004996 [Fusarium euwallaceae]
MNIYVFLSIPIFLLIDTLWALMWSSLFATDPLGSSTYIKNGTWIRPTIPQAGPWTASLDEVQSQLNNIVQDIPDYTTSRAIRSMAIPVNETITFHQVHRNLTIVRQENLNPAGTKIPITELFQAMMDKPSKTIEPNQTWWQWITFRSGRNQLISHGIVLLEILEDAHKSRQVVMDVIRRARQDTLDDLTHQICRVSEELKRHASRASVFEWPAHMNLQETYVATHSVCTQAQAVEKDLKALFDRVGMEMQAIKSRMRQVEGVFADLRKNKPLSEEEMDLYEAELFWIGESVIQLAEGGWLEL